MRKHQNENCAEYCGDEGEKHIGRKLFHWKNPFFAFESKKLEIITTLFVAFALRHLSGGSLLRLMGGSYGLLSGSCGLLYGSSSLRRNIRSLYSLRSFIFGRIIAVEIFCKGLGLRHNIIEVRYGNCKQEDDRMTSFDTCQATILYPDKIFCKNEKKKDISRQTKLRELKLAALHNK